MYYIGESTTIDSLVHFILGYLGVNLFILAEKTKLIAKSAHEDA